MQIVKGAAIIIGTVVLAAVGLAFAYWLVSGEPIVRTKDVITQQSPAALTPPMDAPSPEQSAPVCDVPGSTFVKEIGRCIYTMTNPVEVQKYSADVQNDPKCKGKPAGFRYDEQVQNERGDVGIAHRVCGSRPK